MLSNIKDTSIKILFDVYKLDNKCEKYVKRQLCAANIT